MAHYAHKDYTRWCVPAVVVGRLWYAQISSANEFRIRPTPSVCMVPSAARWSSILAANSAGTYMSMRWSASGSRLLFERLTSSDATVLENAK